MGTEIDIASPGSTFMGYLSVPEYKVGPGIILIHDKFGIDARTRSLVDELSDELDYFVLAPDLFWRTRSSIQLNPMNAEDRREASRLSNSFDIDAGVEDIQTTISALRDTGGCTGRIGVLGYSFGGLLAFLASARTDADASVSIDAISLQPYLGEAIKITNPLLLHLPEGDKTDQALEAYMMASVQLYEGCRHGFCDPASSDYDSAASESVLEKSKAFIKSNLAF